MDNRGVNPFLKAWGELDSWKGGQQQAMILAAVPPLLLASHPYAVLDVALYIGQSHSLRQHIVIGMDALIPELRCLHLHRGMVALRGSRKGLKRWRRYNLDRAAVLETMVQDEHRKLFQARMQMEAWTRAIDHTLGLVRGMDPSPHTASILQLPDVDIHKSWEEMVGRLEGERQALVHLKESVVFLRTGAETLCKKAEKYLEVCHTLPEHEDVLQSKILARLIDEVVGIAPSQIAHAQE